MPSCKKGRYAPPVHMIKLTQEHEIRPYMSGYILTTNVEAAVKTSPAKPIEVKCPACNGTGFLAVIQPAQPGRRIYPPSCTKCAGKGRMTKAAN
jgi:hypothetical protein